ncbi:MAG TPA: serine hydrolase [Gemmatimonadaceae bacterium]|nr:serine hydrolase [Gemmatimonadaceae bacterium]
MMILVAAGLLLAAQSQDSLLQKIQARVAEDSGAYVGVAYIDLASPDTLFMNADTSFHAASTMKVPVMIELFRRANTGSFRMDQGLMMVNQFASLVDGSPYTLDIGSDSDSTLYHRIGERVRVDSLLRLMITRSSNFATNTLITLVGADAVTKTMRELGAKRIQVLRGVEDGKAFQQGLNNTTTARDLAIILRAIEEGRAAAPDATQQMLSILTAQEFNEKIPAGLPPGTRVAHKTGDITAVSHDAAIVYPPGGKPYVLVVLTKGIADGAKSAKLIADISSMVYSHNVAAHMMHAATGSTN